MAADLPALRVAVCEKIAAIDAQAWNRLVHDQHPFLQHAFLDALETHQCVGKTYGWIPRHIAVYEADELIAALPLYEKHNNYGEFVFDHLWSEAYRQHQLSYYPKLVSAVPYTPATGQRFLVAEGREADCFPLLLHAVQEVADALKCSGFHCLFPEEQAMDWLQDDAQLLVRYDCQFHWHNQQYQDFDHFLSHLAGKKRKNIRQERQRVDRHNVTIRRLNGHTASDEDWAHFARFYENIFNEKYGVATFNLAAFQAIARSMPDQVLLVLADYEGKTVAGALMYHSDTTLYGRHWGCDVQLDGLHFELCYYQGIEFCIEKGLQRFEPGAQGEHKLSRGFLPTLTRSAHWMAQDYFKEGLARFVQHEQQGVMAYIHEMQNHSPYKEVC